ncbi:MAG: hypothetical protein O2970_10465 [Proteobacteria bacterium]|nr:hypothetical protein [Pseudomonadota bacterium]MDA0967364.1 hypothetical protein [Pseudomonadota bacterium]
MTISPTVSYFEEPLLEFKFGQKLVYPRDGLFLYGPVDESNDNKQIRYGVISTAGGLKHFKAWAKSMNGFIDIPAPGPRSRSNMPHHVPFPGFTEAFGAEWPTEPTIALGDIDPKELSRVLRIGNRHEAVQKAVDLFVSPMLNAVNRMENPPSFWFVVIPEDVYQLGRPLSQVPRGERVLGAVHITQAKAKMLQAQPTLFGTDEVEAEVYKYAAHFRRQLKARLLKDKIVTQLVRETTLEPQAFLTSSGHLLRPVEDAATIAWKLGTGCYYKAGGRPWQLADVRPGVCYVGLVYKQDDSAQDRRYSVCAAQMFLSNGEGIVFRGALGPWYHTEKKEFHLDRKSAKSLISTIVSEYTDSHGAPPKELFIHAQAAFSHEEWTGFFEGCPDTVNLVGIQITDAKDGLKLFRPGEYPVMRGMALKINERQAYLWTAGYVPRLDTYMGPETPNPIFIKVQRGKCPLDQVLQDILGLTKINFNSCLLNDRMPVTIKFANAVGDVLTSAPLDSEPKLPFKYYI